MMKYQRKWIGLSLLVLATALTHQTSASAQATGISHAPQASATTSVVLPTWQYSTTSSVDGNPYKGWMVGRSPFYHGARTTNVPTYVVPVIVNMPDGGVFDPTLADSTCLGGSTPQTLFQQSPLILKNTSFSFGATPVGTTQYTDAFQRGNFWNAPSNVAATGNSYHTILGPVQTLPAVTVNVPLGLGATYQSTAYSSTGCGSFGVADFATLDSILRTITLPTLIPSGISPASLVIFLMYNVVEAYPGTNPSSQCCSLGYHGASAPANPTPTSPIQTYVTADFDSTGLFGNANIASISHQLAAWMDDPLSVSSVPLWVPPLSSIVTCQNVLDPGYPLIGFLLHPGAASSNVSAQTSTFTYDLQELAFYSWFYRQGPSLGVNGWFSTNNTLTTDAGAVCVGS